MFNEHQIVLNVRVNKTNKYGDPQYIEDENETITINKEGFWSIKNPSSKMKELCNTFINGSILYTCSSGEYIISPKSSKVIKKEGEGLCCSIRLRFKDTNGKLWCLMVCDNKHYLRHLTGVINNDKTNRDCIIRVSNEQLRIDMINKPLIKWAEFSFLENHDLVDCSWIIKNIVFFTQLEWKDVSHLFTNHHLIDNKINIINTKEYGFVLDETEYIVCIPEYSSSSNMIIPTEIEDIRRKKKVNGIMTDVPLEFTGHHRALYEYFCTGQERPLPSFHYLHTFDMFKREKEVMDEFERCSI